MSVTYDEQYRRVTTSNVAHRCSCGMVHTLEVVTRETSVSADWFIDQCPSPTASTYTSERVERRCPYNPERHRVVFRLALLNTELLSVSHVPRKG